MSTTIPKREWSCGYGDETEYGTAVTCDKWVGRVLNVKPAPKHEIGKLHSSGKALPDDIYRKKIERALSLEYFPQDGQWLTYALGLCVTTGSASPWTHTISPIEGALPSFSLEVGSSETGGLFTRKFAGCKITKIQISNAVDEYLKVIADVNLQNQSKPASPQSLTPITTEPYHFDVGAITINSVAYAVVKRFTLTCERPFERVDGIGDAEQVNVSEGRWRFLFSGTLFATNANLYDLMEAETKFDMDALYTRGTGDTLKLQLTDCMIGENPLEAPDNSPWMQTPVIEASDFDIIVDDATETYPNE